MEFTLKSVLDRARRADLRSIRTEVSALGAVFVVRSTLTLGNQEFSAHAVAEHPHQLRKAEDEAILAALQYAGYAADELTPPTPMLQVVSPPPPPQLTAAPLFQNSGPLFPEMESEPEAEDFEAFPDIDRESLMTESSALMAEIKMDKRGGRSYLIQTYNKQARQDLNDEELLSFVEYLRAQQHANQSSRLPF
ncbi:MAG: hypothetical protein H7Y37_19255 [Anaerolineae bacterium]|nr:hypothetical protein [Gloeobacterales cyanobacterium ES-bin-313]